MMQKSYNEVPDFIDEIIPKSIYYNRPQLLSKLIQPKEEYAVWGRGTGKSDGLLADRSLHNVHAMPQSIGCFVQHTYIKLLSDILPKIISGWERMGYKRDIHFFVGKHPPKKWKWNEPFKAPVSYDYFIPWYNGSGIRLISQDRSGISNGQDNDWIAGDEIKFLNKKKFDEELVPTNRGNVEHFGHLSEHHSIIMSTDMPTSKDGKWILDKKDLMDPEQIQLILAVQNKILNSKSQAEIKKLTKYLVELRMDCVYYSEFSSFENIHILGLDYIKQQKRILPPLVFRAAILGERIINGENGFYGLLSERHKYDHVDYSYIDSLDYQFDKLNNIDCRMDADLDRSIPLDIALDYGASINTVVIGQDDRQNDREQFRFKNALFIKHPDRLRDLAKKFCNYYEHFPIKVVYFYYDNTAISTDADRVEPLYSIFADELIAREWTVNLVYIGQAPEHKAKYYLWQQALHGSDTRLPFPLFNKSNCKYLLISMEGAEIKQTEKEFKKNKDDERNKNINQEETTHFSDAADTLYFGKFASRIKETSDYFDVIYH